jgi:hypothetical protein
MIHRRDSLFGLDLHIFQVRLAWCRLECCLQKPSWDLFCSCVNTSVIILTMKLPTHSPLIFPNFVATGIHTRSFLAYS